MTAYPEVDGKQDVVFQVGWVCSGTDGQFNAASYGVTDLTLDPAAPFTPYAQLTMEQVLGWVFAVIGEQGIADAQAKVDASIASQTAPTTVTPPLPWN
jgi:hypothetical protein